MDFEVPAEDLAENLMLSEPQADFALIERCSKPLSRKALCAFGTPARGVRLRYDIKKSRLV